MAKGHADRDLDLPLRDVNLAEDHGVAGFDSRMKVLHERRRQLKHELNLDLGHDHDHDLSVIVLYVGILILREVVH